MDTLSYEWEGSPTVISLNTVGVSICGPRQYILGGDYVSST